MSSKFEGKKFQHATFLKTVIFHVTDLHIKPGGVIFQSVGKRPLQNFKKEKRVFKFKIRVEVNRVRKPVFDPEETNLLCRKRFQMDLL